MHGALGNRVPIDITSSQLHLLPLDLNQRLVRHSFLSNAEHDVHSSYLLNCLSFCLLHADVWIGSTEASKSECEQPCFI